MRAVSVLVLSVLILGGGDLVLLGWQRAADTAPKFALAEPGISPDGREIAFAAQGDLWTVPASGGEARLLVADPAFDRRPLFSPDGRSLAFVSMRTGGGDIYVLTLATGALRRVTWDDGLDQLDAWGRDSDWIYFSSTGRDIAGMNDVFRVRAAGGTPMAVTGDAYVNEFGAAPSPDGRNLAFTARGVGSAQWWRKAGSHLDQSELWLMNLDAAAASAYTRLTERDARQLWPMWHPDGRALYYVSSRGGAENVWTRPAASSGAERAITRFRDGRVLWPSITADGRAIAFERDFGIWTLDTSSGQARQLSIALRGAATAPAPERVRLTNTFQDLALSPDGRKVALIARGDVFAASAKDGGDAARVTVTPAIESQPAWAPDSRRLAYVSARGAGQQIYLYDFASSAESSLTSGESADLSPVFAPDGKSLAYLRDRRQLRVVDLATRADRVLATGTFADTLNSPVPVWSPDGKWIAVFAIGGKAFTNVSLVSSSSAAGNPPARPVSFLANVFANTIAWSRDGTYLLFDTRQRTEEGRLARVDLVPRTPKFREDLFLDLFGPPQNPRAPEPQNPALRQAQGAPSESGGGTPEPVFTDIRQRLSLLPIGLDVGAVTVSPDGKTAVVIATSAGQSNLYAWSLDDLATERPVARQLTTTAGAKASLQWTPDSREVYFLDAGRIQIATVDRRESRSLAVTAELTSDFSIDKRPVFDQAWTLLRDNFFDPSFNGVDWEASRRIYGERADAAATAEELRRVISLMVGDLNASHLGISAPPGGSPPSIGRLGLTFDRIEYETRGRLRVTSVIPLGPAALARGIAPGDVIAAVNGVPIGPRVNLDEILANTADRRVVLSVAGAPDASRPGPAPAAPRDVVVRPTNQATEKSLLYQQWVDRNRKYVLRASGGRLGYVHMINMSAAALDQLYVDLDTENHALDGVVVDIRNNSGGFVNAYAIDVFTRQPYLRMSTRGVPEAPARTILGQRALESPTVLVTNQHSLSDAEDFTEGYRTLKLGPVVGEPTAGWIVYTWDVRLVDGSTLRLPRMRVKAADGTDMEWHPRPVDHPASRPVGEALAGQDSQLDEAIRVLLRRLGRAE
jgi:tricorn protease